MGNGVTGIFGPILLFAIQMQTLFYQKLTAALDAFSSNSSAGFWLIGLSFLYGIFHAVGPGHGKAVISSYVVATGDTRRRAVLLSLIASILQAVSAIIIISATAMIFNATATTITKVTDNIEMVSYGLVALLGLGLLFVKGRIFFKTWQRRKVSKSGFACDAIPAGVTSESELLEIDPNAVLHGVNCACVEVSQLAIKGREVTWKEMIATVLSIGVRPCSGALIVLVFAMSRNLYMAGVASVFAMAGGTALTVGLVAFFSGTARNLLNRFAKADSIAASRLSASLQFAAALVVFCFGSLMLAGVAVASF